MKIVILGAGLSGLSTAYHLEQAGIKNYELYERDTTHIGGLTKTFRIDGFSFDCTGHFLHSNNAYFTQLLTQLFPESLEKIARQAFIYYKKHYVDYPFQTNLGQLPLPIITECIEEFIKRPQISAPKNFHQWLLTAFGKGLCKHFFSNYNKKMLLVSLKSLMPEQGGRFIPHTELAEILANLMQGKNIVKGYNSSFLYPKTGGIDHLPRALATQISNPIHLGKQAVWIDEHKKKIIFNDGSWTTYDVLVSTMPLDTLLGSLTHDTRNNLKPHIPQMQCTTVVSTNLGINYVKEAERHWIYFPEKKYSFYRVGWWSAISKSMAPQGSSSLYAERMLLNPKPDDIRFAHEKLYTDLLKFNNLHPQDITLRHDVMLDHGYVLYTSWRKKNLPHLLDHLATNHILSIGRFGEWKYSSMQEAILDGKMTAEKIMTTYHDQLTQEMMACKQHPFTEKNVSW